MAYEGEIAALATAFCWSTTSLFFAAAGKRIGSFQVNQIRIVMAVVFLLIMHLIAFGSIWPSGATWRQFGLLAASGIVGLFLGDTFYFKALVDLGPKLATLLMSLYPLFAAFIAWFALGEMLGGQALSGMMLAIGGVAIAVTGRRSKKKNNESRLPGHLWLGLACGLLGAIGQGAGIVIAKAGLQDFNSLSGTLIRMTVAMVALWTIAGFQFAASRRSGKSMALFSSLRDFRALGFTAGGAFFGPFVGVWLSLFAVMHSKVGIVATIMATIPIIIIPQTWIIHREKPTFMELLGALTTFSGVVLLVLS